MSFLTLLVSFQHVRGGSGTSLISMVNTKILSNAGKVALLEMDFLNPLLHYVFPQKNLKAHVNDFLFGEASLDDILVDVGQDVNERPKRLWFGYMNPLEGARRRLELADAARDKRIIRALENVSWKIEGMPLDFVLIDTAPWSNCILDITTIISDIIFFIIKPNMIELTLFFHRYTTQLYRVVAKVVPIINFCSQVNEKHVQMIVKTLREKCPECENIITIPYYPDLASGLSKELFRDTSHSIYDDLRKVLLSTGFKERSFFQKHEISAPEEGLHTTRYLRKTP